MGETGVTSGRGQGSTVLPVAAAAMVVVVVIVVTTLLNSGGAADGFDLRTSQTIPSGHAADAVIRVGDTVRGSGAVVTAPDGTRRFCPPVATVEGQTCPLGLALTGPGVRKLGTAHSATITGVYRGDAIAVTDVRPYRPPGHPQGHDDVVPCTAPDGGWPDGTVDMSAAQRYQAGHPGDVVVLAILRPSRAAAVAYVVTAGDPTATGDALTRTYGKRLCVVQSRFSAQQITAAKTLITSHVGRHLTDVNNGGGPTIDSHGSVEIEGTVPVVTDAFAKAVDAQPAKLIQLTVWLRPTG
jgi:hypothetical protein